MPPPLKAALSYWLNKYNIRPNKRLGQCFLISDKALEKIISTANIHKKDKILEIGPGTGILTEKLLDKGANVLAIEKDSRFIEILKLRFSEALKNKQLILLQSDFLKIKFPEFLIKNRFLAENYKVVANLPYQITSPAIERLLERNFLPLLVVLTIQKEVAERVCAKPGELNSLAVLVQSCAQKCQVVAKFPSSNFYPAPEIDSALIKLERIAYPEGINIKRLRQIIHAGFSQKRKKLRKNLQNVFGKEKVDSVWEKINIPENTRAQELPVKQWVAIAKLID